VRISVEFDSIVVMVVSRVQEGKWLAILDKLRCPEYPVLEVN
jgi:hypothetical protein